MSSSPSSPTPASRPLKGKLTNRSWPQLPHEIIQKIGVFYIHDMRTSMYIPDTWHIRALWDGRLVYMTFRIAIELEKLMRLCPSWFIALEELPFWSKAYVHLDPAGVYENARLIYNNQASSAPPLVMTAYRHYKNLARVACFVCRVNRPSTQYGVNASGRREVYIPYLGRVPYCKDHRRSTYCGVCLREMPPSHGGTLSQEAALVSCVTNDDSETWPYAHATCRCCRAEALWRYMSGCQSDRDAVGGGPPKWDVYDPETRQAIEYFIDTGEGTVAEVATIAREKHWLHQHTRMSDFLEEAVAAHRLSERMENADVYGAAELEQEEFDLDEFEDMTMPEHLSQAREMAILDWARTRILDGYWVTPADDYYEWQVQYTRAEHPAPWTLAEEHTDERECHPSPSVTDVPKAPTYSLAENLYRVFTRQMRNILGPALCNIVKRIALCANDPALYATRMQVEDVLHELKQAYAWSKELSVESLPALPASRRCVSKDELSSPTTSSFNDSPASRITSPVLSTTTLATTPSPPPREKVEASETESGDPEPVSPVESDGPPPPDPANMMHTIPFIPVSLSRLPTHSVGLFRQIWREQCAPLYQCNCAICARALRAQYVAPAQAAPAPALVPSQQEQHKQTEIQLQESRFPAEEEEEEEEEDDEEDDDRGEWWVEDSDGEGDVDADPDAEERESAGYDLPTLALKRQLETWRGRQGLLNRNGKRVARPEEEEEEEEEEEGTETEAGDSVVSLDGRRSTSSADRRTNSDREHSVQVDAISTPPRAYLQMLPGTPPKRARLIGEYSPVTSDMVPARHIKRRSEGPEEVSPLKRARVPTGNVSTNNR